MNIYKYILSFLLTFLIAFASCSDISYDYENVSNGKEISDFTIPSLELAGRTKGTKDITRKEDTIYLVVSSGYDLSKLKNVVPSFTISIGASVTPAVETPQDFSSLSTPVKYTVTSESGQIKDWYIKTEESQFIEEGAPFEVSKRLWLKEGSELGLTANIENTIATIGDKIVVSRTGLAFDGKTGESAGVLNMDGIIGNPSNPATNIPFVLTNDDAGNLIGGTLGAWSTPYFRVYKWSSLTQAPQEIISYEAAVKPGGPGNASVLGEFGRKMIAGGNINANGYVASYNYKTAEYATQHSFWWFKDGMLDGNEPEIDKTVYNSGSIYQIMYPLKSDAVRPYFVCDPGGYNPSIGNVPTTLLYAEYEGTARKEFALVGSIPPAEGGGSRGWGAKIYHIQLFEFNKRSYMIVLHVTNNNIYYLSVLDLDSGKKDEAAKTITYDILLQETVPADVSQNVNGTAGTAYFKETDATGTQRVYIYGLMTSKGILCCEINNLVK